MSRNSSTEPRRLLLLALLVAVVLLGTALRLYGLDADSLWADEIYTSSRAQKPLLSIVADAGGDVHPPLSYVVTKVLTVMFGDSEFILRLQAMLFGSLSILLVYEAGRILWIRQVGLIAAFLLAVNAYHVRYSQEARQYALMVFLALLSLIFLAKALQKNQKRLWIGFALCTSLSLYNHYFAFLFLGAETVFASFVIGKRWLSNRRHSAEDRTASRSKRLSAPVRSAVLLAASLALVTVLFLPWFPTMVQQLFGPKLDYQGVSTVLLSRLDQVREQVLYSFAAYSGVEGGLLLLSLGLFFVGLAGCSPDQLALLVPWLAGPFVFMLVVTSEHGIDPRHMIFVVVAYLLALAVGLARVISVLDRVLRTTDKTHKRLAVVTPLIVVLFSVTSVAPLRDYYYWEKEDWRSAALYLRGRLLPGDVIIADGVRLFGGDAIRVQNSLSFYLDRYATESTPILRARRGLAEALAHNLGEGRGQVWAVVYHDDGLSLSNVRSQLEIVDFQDISIMRLENPSGELMEDTVSTLSLLLDVLPDQDTHFDLHLALADLYLRVGRFEQAESQIEMASQVMPDTLNAPRRLARVRNEFDQLLHRSDEDIPRPQWRSLGLQVALLGYEVHSRPEEAGGTWVVTLWWQALSEMDKDYTSFVHLLDVRDHLWTQEDRLLLDGEYPTSAWEVGTIVEEEYRLHLLTDAPPGDYTIQTGIYLWETSQRLPVWDELLQREDRDAITLTGITLPQ